MKFKKGQIVKHLRYGTAKVAEIYHDPNAVLLDELSSDGITLLNKDRQIKKMPIEKPITRCYEDNLELIK